MLILHLSISFCSSSLSFCPQGLTGGASAMVRWRSNPCVLWLSFVGCCVLCHDVGMTNDPVTSDVCSLYQMRASFTKWNLQILASELHENVQCFFFMQLGCTQYEIHEFLREHLQSNKRSVIPSASMICCVKLPDWREQRNHGLKYESDWSHRNKYLHMNRGRFC